MARSSSNKGGNNNNSLPPLKRTDFPVPPDLRTSAARIYCIAIDDEYFVVEFFDKTNRIKDVESPITGRKQEDIDSVRMLAESKLSAFFDEATVSFCTRRIAEMISGIYDTERAKLAIEKIKKHKLAVETKFGLRSAADGGRVVSVVDERPVYVIKKFTGPTSTFRYGMALAEAVIIEGKPMFAVHSLEGGHGIKLVEELETADMVLRPPTKQEYPPDSYYEYKSEDEFYNTIEYAAKNDSIYKIYHDVKPLYTKEYFVDTDLNNSSLLAIYTITSYSQDKFSTAPYIWLIGDNGSGKGSIILVYTALGYRVFYMSGASGANICEYLGTIEEGQGTIAEDELDNLDKDQYKQLLYKMGYQSGTSIPKILDASSRSRIQQYYKAYCQKMSASENLPSMKYAKGVLDREFIIKCVKGFPKYNIKAIKKHTKTKEVERLVNLLSDLRKRLFAYRLVHFDDVIPEVKRLTISGRALELTESALSLFHKYRSTPEDEETFNNEILPVLSAFLKERLGRRNDSLEARMYPEIMTLVNSKGGDGLAIDNDTIYAWLQLQFGGKAIPDRIGAFYMDDLDMEVSRSMITKILREKFKAQPIRIIDEKTGSRDRGHRFQLDVLQQVARLYEDPWEIKILPTEESSDGSSARPDQVDQSIEDSGGSEKVSEDGETTTQQEGNERREITAEATDMSEDPQNGSQNAPLTRIEAGQPGQLGHTSLTEESIVGEVETSANDEV
jgi:hypothetical protein